MGPVPAAVGQTLRKRQFAVRMAAGPVLGKCLLAARIAAGVALGSNCAHSRIAAVGLDSVLELAPVASNNIRRPRLW